MVIRKMKPEHASDWFDFFDNRAFSDHEDWKGCYCTGPFFPRVQEYENASRKRKDYAKWLMERGIMRGYLAYEHGTVVGWSNVNDKSAFSKLNHLQTDEESVISITCFTIQKEYRGRGIAQRLLHEIIKDARKNNTKIIEAYPRKNAKTEFGRFRGPHSMYEKNGFKFETVHDCDVARLYL